MKLETANLIAKTVKKAEYYKKSLDDSNSGYSDEWVLQNEETGQRILLRADVFEGIQDFFKSQIEKYCQEIEDIK